MQRDVKATISIFYGLRDVNISQDKRTFILFLSVDPLS